MQLKLASLKERLPFFWRIGVISLCFVGMFTGAIGCQQDVSEAPGLTVVGPAEHNFGKCVQGELLAHEFTLVNNTREPIEIVELRTSCSCVIPGGDDGFHETEVLPNAKVKLPIRFTTGSQQETASARVIAFYSKVGASDRQHLDLRVRADVLPDYRIEPRELDFGEIDGLGVQEVSRTIRVTPVVANGFKLRSARCSSDWLTTYVTPQNPADGGYIVNVTLHGSQFTKSKSLSSSIILESNSERLPQALVRVRAEYVSPVSIVPEMIVISSGERGEVEREVRVITECPARVKDITCTAGGQVCPREDIDQKISQNCIVNLVVQPCIARSLNCEVQFEVEVFPFEGQSVVRKLSLPVHRFHEKRS